MLKLSCLSYTQKQRIQNMMFMLLYDIIMMNYNMMRRNKTGRHIRQIIFYFPPSFRVSLFLCSLYTNFYGSSTRNQLPALQKIFKSIFYCECSRWISRNQFLFLYHTISQYIDTFSWIQADSISDHQTHAWFNNFIVLLACICAKF